MQEQVLRGYREKFIHGNGSVIIPTWNGVVMATRFYKMFDPSRCLTRSDFKQAGLLGIVKAFNKYNPESACSLRTWTITLINQAMRRELKHYSRPTIPLSETVQVASDSSQSFIDHLMMKISENFEPSVIGEDLEEKIIERVSSILYIQNRSILRLFELKLENPDSDNAFFQNNLNLANSTYNKYMHKIRDITKGVMKNYD